jgi:putative ABC transport system permease protein
VVRAELRRSREATAAAVILIALAVALGVAVTAQERALRAGGARAADPFDLVVGARGSPTQLILSTVYLRPGALELLPDAILTRLEQERGVAWMAPLAFGDSHLGSPIVGTTAAFVNRGGTLSLAHGRVFTSIREAVVGADVPLGIAASFVPAHGEPGGPGARDDALHQGVEHRVVGRLPRLGTPWDRAILVPIEAVWRTHARPSGHPPGLERIGPPWETGPSGVSAIVVRPASVADAYRLRGRFRTSDSLAIFPAEVLMDLHATLGDARDLLAAIALLTQGLVVAAVMLAVLASQAQRRRLFGVLRALGASRAYVMAAVWIQVSALVAAGGLAGLVLGWAAALATSGMVQSRTGLTLTPTVAGPEIRLVGWLILVSALGALLPAWRAHRRPVASLLRA